MKSTWIAVLLYLFLFPTMALAGTCGNNGDGAGASHCTGKGPWTADSASDDDVAQCVEVCAVDGDVVNIPAGSETWTRTIHITDKYISLIGAGADITIITDDTGIGHDEQAVLVDNDAQSPKNGFLIAHIKFIPNVVDGKGIIGVWDAGPDWRIHDCVFESAQSSGNLISAGTNLAQNLPDQLGGLIDNCKFVSTHAEGGVKAFSIVTSNYEYEPSNSSIGQTSWERPHTLGTRNAIYIEDCEFNWTHRYPMIDVDNGGRVVFRYNKVIGAGFGTHGSAENDDDYGVFSYEIYRNSFDDNGNGMWTAIGLRGGSGVIHNNTFSGTYNDAITLYLYCICDPQIGACPYNVCTYPCRGQIGRSTNQTLDALRIWSNTYNDGLSRAGLFDTDCDEVNDAIVLNRDYYESADASAARSDYTPYTYPHPLRGSTPDATPPTPPLNLRIRNQ